MIRKIVVGLFAVVAATMAAPGMGAEIARSDQEQKHESARVSDKRAQPDSAVDSVDCFYESNRSHQDCGESKTVNR